MQSDFVFFLPLFFLRRKVIKNWFDGSKKKRIISNKKIKRKVCLKRCEFSPFFIILFQLQICNFLSKRLSISDEIEWLTADDFKVLGKTFLFLISSTFCWFSISFECDSVQSIAYFGSKVQRIFFLFIFLNRLWYKKWQN